MSGKTFQPDKTRQKVKVGNKVIALFVVILFAIYVLQIMNNVRLSNTAQDDRAAATFFAESVQQMCQTEGTIESYRGICREAIEYSENLNTTYDLTIDSREVRSIECEDDGSIIHFKNGDVFESDRLCGEGQIFVTPLE